MQEFIPWNTLTFQFTNLYDRNNLEFTKRVTQHLRESIYILTDESHNGIKQSLILGDIIPEKYLSDASRHFIYLSQYYSCVEDIIIQLNNDIFGEDLIEIPDPDIDIVVKFVYALNNKN
jgi:hypothetical protein